MKHLEVGYERKYVKYHLPPNTEYIQHGCDRIGSNSLYYYRHGYGQEYNRCFYWHKRKHLLNGFSSHWRLTDLFHGYTDGCLNYLSRNSLAGLIKIDAKIEPVTIPDASKDAECQYSFTSDDGTQYVSYYRKSNDDPYDLALMWHSRKVRVNDKLTNWRVCDRHYGFFNRDLSSVLN